MKLILIYVSKLFKNKNYVENNINNIEKLYIDKFNLNELKEILNNYDYLIYLNDNTDYNFDNLSNDINKSIDIINNGDNIEQVLFNNYDYENIDERILNIDENHIKRDITIFKDKQPKYRSEINYLNYLNKNFNRLFLPSIIKIEIFKNYENKLINEEHYELNFLKEYNLNRFVLNNDIRYNINKFETIKNINDKLTIITGFIKLNEEKIQKYEKQTYEYLDKCNDTLKIDINMVIYVSEELKDIVYKKREEFGLIDKTKIIVVSIENYMYNYDKINIVEENIKKNHINYSSAKKILSVLTRYNYLKDTINNNYFKSDYFAWLDFSAGHIVNIPENLIIDDNFENKINIGWIARCNGENFKYNYKVFAGGYFIGKKEPMIELIRLHNIYFNILLNYGFTINDDKLLFYIFENNPFLFKTFFTDYKHILIKSLK